MMKIGLLIGLCTAVLMAGGCLLDNSLNLQILFDDVQGLRPGSQVVFGDDQRVIGQVTEVATQRDGQKSVKIKIDPGFKELIRTGAIFVEDAQDRKTAHISVYVMEKDQNNPVIASDSTVKGTSRAEYMIARGADIFGKFLQNLADRSNRFLAEIEKFVNSNDFQNLMTTLKDQVGQLDQYSKKQLQYFEREILPKLEQKIKEAIESLQNSDQAEEAERLRRELQEMKDKLEEVKST